MERDIMLYWCVCVAGYEMFLSLLSVGGAAAVCSNLWVNVLLCILVPTCILFVVNISQFVILEKIVYTEVDCSRHHDSAITLLSPFCEQKASLLCC